MNKLVRKPDKYWYHACQANIIFPRVRRHSIIVTSLQLIVPSRYKNVLLTCRVCVSGLWSTSDARSSGTFILIWLEPWPRVRRAGHKRIMAWSCSRPILQHYKGLSYCQMNSKPSANSTVSLKVLLLFQL